jgi:hypothetical protein
MALDPDPYRVLELSRGASLDDVKRAYRRLAKANHPDAAGEAALPRFLAIQAAYEQLIGPADGATRGRRPAPTTRQPWDADPDRSDATRRAYGGRGRSAPPGGRAKSGGGSGSATGAAGGAASGADAAGGAASARPGRRRRPAPDDAAGTPPPGSRRASRSPRTNKATLGSTSYDGADAEAFEPDWGGASWYGTTSGTYWTLNPKEYADPRKHGPEYQARARRAAKGEPRESGAPTPPPATADPTHTTSSWWDSTAGGPSTPPPTSTPPAGTAAHDPSTSDPSFDFGGFAAGIGRMLIDERAGGMQGRVVRAIVGWIPIALAIGWSIGELTGCGRFAATCDGSSEPVALGLQIVTLAILLAVPSLAALATIATMSVLVAAVFGALTLSSTGEAADLEARAATLGVVLLAAWAVGLGVGIARRVRAAPSPPSPTRPVS